MSQSGDQKAKWCWRQGCPWSSWAAGTSCFTRRGSSVARRSLTPSVELPTTHCDNGLKGKWGYYWPGWAKKSCETFLQQFSVGSCKPFLVLAHRQAHIPWTSVWDFVPNTHRPSKHTHSQDQPGCKSNVQTVSTPNHKPHPVTWNRAHSAQTSACSWGKHNSGSPQSLQIQPMFWVCNRPLKEAKCPWFYGSSGPCCQSHGVI